MIVKVKEHIDLLIVGGSVSGCDIAVKEHLAGKKVLLTTSYSFFGEDICSSLDLSNIPDFLKKHNVPAVATPMQVKRTLDRLIIKNKVPFLLQTCFLGIVGDYVILGNCEEIFAVRALAVVDATQWQCVLRHKIPTEKFVPQNVRAVYRAIESCSEAEADFCSSDDEFFKLTEIETDVFLDGFDVDAYSRAVLEVRQKCWKIEHFYLADRIIFPDLPEVDGEDIDELVFSAANYKGIVRKNYMAESVSELEYIPDVEYEVDIAVAGGGTAGAAAAIPGALQGLRTLVIERLSHLGGLGTQGRIAVYWFGLQTAFSKHLDQENDRIGRTYSKLFEDAGLYYWNIEAKQHVWENENINAGASVWFDTLCCQAECENGKITGVLAATPFGGVMVRAEQYIDSTGNAVLAALCGAETIFAGETEPAVQGAGMSPVILGRESTNSDYMFTVDSSNKDVTRAFISGRDRCGDMFDLVQLPGTRERRKIVGEIVLKAIDFYSGRSYPDTICLARSNFDSHGFTIDPLLLYHPTDETPYVAEIPLRALLSPGIANLLTTGLGVSAQRDAMPLIRMQADIQNQGYAAGMIAAGAVMNKCHVRELNIVDIQEELKKQGFFSTDISGEKTGLNVDAGIFDNPDMEKLKSEYLAEPDFEKALRLAHLGDDTGSGLLRGIIKNTPWDDGWDYRGMGQFGKSSSRQDSALLALSRLPAKGVDGKFILPKLKATEPETGFSHIRALCVYLMQHPDKQAVDDLRRILGGFECHAATDFNDLLDAPYQGMTDIEERNFQLRELYLAGALNACFPGDELADRFLSAYRNGLHDLYSCYAEKWS